MFPSADLYNGGLVDPGPGGNNWSQESLTGIKGYIDTRRTINERTIRQMSECAKMWEGFIKKGNIDPFLMREAIRGNPPDWVFPKLHRMAPSIFNEAMTTGDFTLLSTAAMGRMIQANYATVPNTYSTVCRINRDVPDFKLTERDYVYNGEGPYFRVGETSAFNRGKVDMGSYSYRVYKYEKGMGLSWEAVINDDKGIFTSIPQRLAIGGVRTVELYYLQLIANAAGPHPSMYGAAIPLLQGGTIDNRINVGGVVNAPLTFNNLILATGAFMNMATAEGRPIDVSADNLIVLVADGVLYQTLLALKNAISIDSSTLFGASAGLTVTTRNWMGSFTPVYAPELRNILTSNAATSWWIFAKPGGSEPALELGFLSGFDTPQMYRKASNTQRISGGVVQEQGDYDTMQTEVKGLIVFGGTRIDPRITMASNGTGA